ncbi:MAG: CocE/NonD family hydrolase, partial [Bacteroidetes bacterium]
PSPTHGGPTLRQDQLQGPYDQTLVVESRGDLLAFSTPALSQALVVEGAIRLRLYVAADQPDADFAIRLTDVYPDGRSILLRDGILRLRFRDGFTSSDTALATPGQVYALDYTLEDLAQVFPPGHQLRLLVSGANYPRFDLNLQNGGALYRPGDTTVAQLTVHTGGQTASYIDLPVARSSRLSGPLPTPSLQLYPNPAQDRLQVDGLPAGIVSPRYRILDALGREVAQGRLAETGIPVASLAPGRYLLQVLDAQAQLRGQAAFERRD